MATQNKKNYNPLKTSILVMTTKKKKKDRPTGRTAERVNNMKKENRQNRIAEAYNKLEEARTAINEATEWSTFDIDYEAAMICSDHNRSSYNAVQQSTKQIEAGTDLDKALAGLKKEKETWENDLRQIAKALKTLDILTTPTRKHTEDICEAFAKMKEETWGGNLTEDLGYHEYLGFLRTAANEENAAMQLRWLLEDTDLDAEDFESKAKEVRDAAKEAIATSAILVAAHDDGDDAADADWETLERQNSNLNDAAMAATTAKETLVENLLAFIEERTKDMKEKAEKEKTKEN